MPRASTGLDGDGSDPPPRGAQAEQNRQFGTRVNPSLTGGSPAIPAGSLFASAEVAH